MPNAMTASALGLMALVGAIVGIDLGRSTIAKINPAYFSSPPPGHYYAELTPAGYQPGAAGHDLTSTATDGPSPLECLDCPVAVSEGDFGSAAGMNQQTWRPGKPLPMVIRGIPQGELERYMNYPVTQEEAQRQAEQKSRRYVRREVEESSENAAAPAPDGL